MGVFFAASIPGLVVMLVLLAAFERFSRYARSGRGRASANGPLGGIAFDEITTLFYAGKRDELVHREALALMRDDAAIDLPVAKDGLITLRMPSPRR